MTRSQESGAWTGKDGKYNTAGKNRDGRVKSSFKGGIRDSMGGRAGTGHGLRKHFQVPRMKCAERNRCQFVHVRIQFYPIIVLSKWQARTKSFREKSFQASFGSTPAVFGGIVGVAKMQSLRRFLTTRTKKRCDALAGVGVDRQGSKYPLSVLF